MRQNLQRAAETHDAILRSGHGVTEQAKQISSNQSTLALMAYTDGVTSLSFREDI